MTGADYRQINRQAWEELAAAGSDSSEPWDSSYYLEPRRCLDPEGWVPWAEIQSVLSLASSGGQQAPLLASLGCDVTVVDLSAEQLRRDRLAAAAQGLTLECIEGDMLDLAGLRGRAFDLVFQAVSACYVPDVGSLYGEVASVLRPGGWYLVEHWNPVHLQLDDQRPWDGEAYRLVRPQVPAMEVPWTTWNERAGHDTTCLHYLHPLSHLLGYLCEAGFAIRRFAERGVDAGLDVPGSHAHLSRYLPAFMRILAQRC